MAKLKYDLSDVEDLPEREHAPVGTYRAKIVSAEPKTSSNDNQMIEVRFNLTHDASGKKLKADYNDIWEYVILDHEHPFVQNKLKNFLTAVGLKLKGTIDTDKIVGTSVQVKLKSDTDEDGDYRPRAGKFMPVTAAEEEPEEAEDEDADEGEDDDEDAVDLDALSRAELKALIKSEELDITVKKSMTDDELREAIAEAMSDDEDEDGDEEDTDEEEADDDEEGDEEEDDDTVDLDSLDRSELKALIKEQGLDVKVLKKDDDDALRAKIAEAMGSDDEEDGDDDEEEDDEKSTDYSSWAVADLKKALKERELASSGSKAVLIKRLQKDDGDAPF